MAAQGTGLPTAGGEMALTPLADTGAYGAAERASADALFRAAKGLDGLVDQMQPALQQEAVKQAEQKVLAGEFEQKVPITGFDQAFNGAMRQGTMARLANQRDADLDKFVADFAFDPNGLQSALQQYRSDAIKAVVPGELAVEWGVDFDARSTRALGQVRAARAEADIREAKGDTLARIDRLTNETITLSGGRSWEELADDADVQGSILQIALMTEGLAGNPAYGVGTEQALALAEEATTKIMAGAIAGQQVSIYRQQGGDAALASLEALSTSDIFASEEQRRAVVTLARGQLSDAINLDQQRVNLANQQRQMQEQEAARLIEDDIAKFRLTGAGSGLTEDKVRELGGDPAVLRWYEAKAKATEDRALYADLPDDPDAAAEEIALRLSRQSIDAGLPIIASEGDLATYTAAIEFVESRGRNGLVSADPDGAGPASGGAYGLRQLLPETARRVAGQLGLPFDLNRLRNDAAYNRAIGDRHFQNLVTYYRGDAFLAVTAYHAGEGNVDGWLRSVGDPRTGQISREAWLTGVESRGNPRSAAYPRKVLEAMQGGKAAAAWDQHRVNRQQVRQDPAASVISQPDVRIARQAWTAAPDDVVAAEGMVSAFLSAQERAGISGGDRRALPNVMLLPYARELAGLESKPDDYRKFTESIIDRFGERGEDVLQDVLRVRGMSDYAAQIAASASAASRSGRTPPTPQQAQAAQRSDAMQSAATGNGRNVRALSDEDVLAAAGLQ